MKKLLAAVSVASVLVAGTAATASAEAAPGRTAPDPTAQMFRPRLQVLKGALQVVLDTLGVSKQELRRALQEGATIAELAAAKGVDPKAVEDALVAKATSKLDEAVAAGTITQARADRIEQRLPERASNFVHREWPRIGVRARPASA